METPRKLWIFDNVLFNIEQLFQGQTIATLHKVAFILYLYYSVLEYLVWWIHSCLHDANIV